jgi:hypothetical protein
MPVDRSSSLAVLALVAAGAGAPALADSRPAVYEVTVTNITRGQTFTPRLVATHASAVQLFELGQPASAALEVLAEDGSPAPLVAALGAAGRAVADVQTMGGLLGPGESSTVTVMARRDTPLISVAAMLIPTNDTFFAVQGARLPVLGSTTLLAPAYDAGTEANDQACPNIPGPRCGGAGLSPGANAGDEGFVHIGNGFHDLAPGPAGTEVLGPAAYDWRNPVAVVRIRRVR